MCIRPTIPRVFLIRASRPTTPLHVLHAPAVCIVAQGEKQVMLADRIYRYDRSRYLTVSVDLPVVGQIISATAEKPYLCFRIDLDPVLLSEILIAAGQMENEETRPGLQRPFSQRRHARPDRDRHAARAPVG